MYNFSKDKPHKIAYSPTPVWVGPNTYDTDEVPNKNENLHPFLSSKPRFETKKPYCNRYYLPKNNDKIKGGYILNTPRFNYALSDIPGPCDFELETKKSAESIDSISKDVSLNKLDTAFKGRGKLHVFRPKFTSGVSAPSVPSKIDQFGYDYDEMGNLIKNTPNMMDTCVCPEKEGPQKDSCKPWGEWRKPTKHRIQYPMTDAPLPGTYDAVDVSKLGCDRVCDYDVQQNAIKCKPVIRYPNDIYRDALRNNYPAPCDYTCEKSRKKYQRLVPFGTNYTKRDSTFVKDGTPAPNEYHIEDRNVCGYQHLKTNLSFGRTERFKPMDTTLDVPPPTRYNPVTMTIAYNATHNIHSEDNYKGAFSTSSPLPPCAHSEATPAPNQYCVQESKDTCKFAKCIPTSKFISKTKRFDDNLVTNEPNPVSYDSQLSFHATQDKKSFLTGKRSKRKPFLIGIPRFEPFNGLASPFLRPSNRLGPGSYNPDYYLKYHLKGFYIPQTDRFPKRRICLPSPGTYTDGNIYTDSFAKAKRTFNKEVNDSILNRLNRKGLSKSKLFMKRATCKKRLVYFLRPHLTVSEVECNVKR